MTDLSILSAYRPAETSTFAVRIYHIPEAISMGCARFTVVAARARAKLHGEYHDGISIDHSPLTFWIISSDPLEWGAIGIGHVGNL